MPQHQLLSIEARSSGLAVVTLNRPQVLNALNTRLAIELTDFLTGAADERTSVRAVVLTGAGDRAFCAGADLKERETMSDDEWSQQHAIFERAFEAVLFCPVPIIIAVNGLAFGGGCELVAACDFAYAARSATFACREIKLAIFPGGSGTQMLPRTIGPKRANEMILTGESIDAATALSRGLVNRVVEDDVLAAAIRTGEMIASNGPLAVRQAKKSMRYSLDVDLRTGLIFEREAYHRLIGSEDRREGIQAFHEKRQPAFVGR